LDILQQKLPVAELVEAFTNWLTKTFSELFSFIQVIGNALMDWMVSTLLFIHPLLFIAFATLAIWFLARKRWPLPTMCFLGLLLIYNQGLWDELMNTLTLVIAASLISIITGIPLGIWMAKNDTVKKIINPILDFMQTMPAFVYLIPAVAFFGIGMVPGVFASVIFALPPTVRFTNLAIREISTELVEAADAFGSTPSQKLFKVELPLAKNTILAGVNQTMMLALSMVVTGSMIGAPGLGREVLSALQKADIGNGFVSGISLVILAIILDRVTQAFNAPKDSQQAKSATNKRVALMALLVFMGSALGRSFITLTSGNTEKGQTVTISHTQWDTEVASTTVIAMVLEEAGYQVKTIPLDNAVMWQSIANGDSDFSVSPWLPVTQKSLYEKHQDHLEDLGPNMMGTKLGLVVPSYMDVNSIEDLSHQTGKTITGIEPGAGIMEAAENALKDYSNLSGWNLTKASTGAMTTTLEKAIANQEEIIVTGWSPHWMFSKYDLKYLDDPKGSFGATENIHTIARKGLQKDMPKLYKIINQFSWTSEDMESVLLDMNEGMSAEEAARKWIEANQETIEKWLE
jgi:glycine betaine/proline transport system substrate-binding protein